MAFKDIRSIYFLTNYENHTLSIQWSYKSVRYFSKKKIRRRSVLIFFSFLRCSANLDFRDVSTQLAVLKIPKLSEAALYPKPIERQRVSTCLQDLVKKPQQHRNFMEDSIV